MTTCIYETISSKADEKPEYDEIKQRRSGDPRTTHPEAGKPIRGVELGGFGVLSSGKTERTESPSGSACCGPGCGCHS